MKYWVSYGMNIIIIYYIIIFLFLKDISRYGQLGDERDCGVPRYETSAPVGAEWIQNSEQQNANLQNTEHKTAKQQNSEITKQRP